MESYFHIQQIQILFQERKKNAKHVSSSEKEDYAELILVAKVRSVRAYCSSAGSLLSFHLLMIANSITRSWTITRNNVNRVFPLFLGYAIDRHDAQKHRDRYHNLVCFIINSFNKHEELMLQSDTGKIWAQLANGSYRLYLNIS